MHNFTSLLKALICTFCVVFLSGISYELMGQCNPPNLLPTPNCQNAPFPVCLENACYSTLNNQVMEHNGFCGGMTVVNNPQYFIFEATSPNVQIQVQVNSCTGGQNGLQVAIIGACDWTNADVIDCNNATVGSPVIVTAAGLIVGQQYWLLIDGLAGALCNYTVTYAQGVYMPVLTDELVSANTPDPVVCQGQDDWTAVANPAIPGASGYLWTGFPWGNGMHTSTFNDMSGPNDPLDIPNNAPVGTYEICVVAFSGCDTTDNEQCFDLTIEAIDDGYSPDVTLCPEVLALGVNWQGMTITSPGTYTKEFNTPEGCPYDSIKTYAVYPAGGMGVIDEVVCAECYTYEGTTYCAAGSYPLFYDNATVHGCDSTAVLNLDLIYLEVETDFYCEFTQFTLTSQVILAIPGQAGIMYEWYHNGLLVSEDATFTTFEPGSYDLFVSYTIDGITCEYPATTNPLVIDLDDLVPPAPNIIQSVTSTCALDFPMYCVEEEPDINDYIWTAPNGVSIFGNGSPCVEVSWANSTGGMLCVRQVNDCGEGVDTCIEVMVIPSPLADFNMPTSACVDSATTITFNGSASMSATLLWNFGAGAQVIQGGTGIGPHVVSWPSVGTRTVTLQIIEPGCDTADIQYNIIVESLSQPVVNCDPTLNSVTFYWPPVPGATGYTVNVLQGPAGVLNDTSYTVSGLTPGAIVEVEIVALSNGACAERSTTVQCIAQSCPPVDIQIMLPADTICLGDVSGPLALSATVDNVASTGTWSGPGVDPAGTFDPNAANAGPGTHQIIFTYMAGTCTYNDQTSITVYETPTATFAADMVICQDENLTVTYTGTASPSATYNWNFAGATVVSGSGAGPYELHWNNPNTYNLSLTVTENDCVSEPVSQSVEVQPLLMAPIVQCSPTTSTVTLQWNNVPNAVMYDVVQTYGPAGTVNGNQFLVTGLNPGDSIAIELTVSGAGQCPPVVVEASCVAKECPAPQIVVEPVDDICLYSGTSPVNLQVTVTNGGGSGSWSGPGVVDQMQGIFDPNVSGMGSHTILYNYVDQGCSFVEQITIDVYDPPMANIGNTDLTLTCDNGNELVLDGSSSTAPGGAIYLWSTSNGVINGPRDQAVVTAGAQGTYMLLVTDMISGCEDAVSVTVMQDAGVPTAAAGSDGTLNCNIGTITLGGNSSTGPTIEYLWTTADGVIMTDPTLPMITAGAGGTYSLLVTDIANGCTSVDQAVIAVDSVAPSAMLAVGEILDCDTETTSVTATVTPAGGNYAYQWQTMGGQIQSGANTSAIVASRPGFYTLYLTNQQNGCMDTSTVEVIGDDSVISGILSAVDNPDCVGDANGQIDISQVMGGTAPFTYSWNTGASTQMIANLSPGTYTVTVSDGNGCRLTESFTLPAPQPLNPDIGPNLSYDVTDIVSVNLSVADSASIADVVWSGVAPPCAGCFRIEFPADTSGPVVVTVIDTNGCEATASLTLKVLRPIHIFAPNVFSPNGDGVNDLFKIGGNTIETINYVRIYDRWGALVHEEVGPIYSNESNGWDGKKNGKELSPGVYVFAAEIIHEDDFVEVIKGDVTLIR